MKLVYTFDEKLINLKETPNGEDVEFTLTLLDIDLKNHLKNIREYFNSNNIVTDVQVYIHPKNEYQIIVRKDFYYDFLLQLFKQQLLLELKWT
jgi:hypothetical protein